MSERRFLTVEDNGACFIVKDRNDRGNSYVPPFENVSVFLKAP
jgi:hypothetical protein